jgi:hypothetical protein
MWSGADATESSAADDTPPVERRDLTHSGTHMEQGKPEALPLGKRAVRQADGAAGKG